VLALKVVNFTEADAIDRFRLDLPPPPKQAPHRSGEPGKQVAPLKGIVFAESDWGSAGAVYSDGGLLRVLYPDLLGAVA
jgi:hypothetical protein